jgi:hypothetical protein
VRTRDVLEAPANGGLPCGPTQEVDPCNTQRCPEDRAAILVDRIRKLELQDRINTLEELQAKQAAELAASQTADLLSQVGGGGDGSTGGAAPSFVETSFLEMLSSLYSRMDSRRPVSGAQNDNALKLQAFKASIDNAKKELNELTKKNVVNDDEEDEVTDEVDAQGHHHKRHHKKHRNADDNKFSQAAGSPLETVPPLFTHTVAIPAGNNNDFIQEAGVQYN